MRLLVTGLAAIVFGACGGSEPAEEPANASGTTNMAEVKWQSAGEFRGRTMEIDVGTMTVRGDTVRVKGRIHGGDQVVFRDLEVACSANRFRHMDKDRNWQDIRPGPPEVMGEAACAEARKR